MLHSAHLSPETKQYLDRFSHLCRAHSRMPSGMPGMSFPLKLPFQWGIWAPSNTWFLEPTRVHTPNGISIGSAILAGFMAERPYTLQWTVPFSQNCPFPWGSGPQSNTWFLGPTVSFTQTASWAVQPFLQGSLLWQTDRQTDHPTRSVTIACIYVRSASMWPNNIQHCTLSAVQKTSKWSLDTRNSAYLSVNV